MKKNNVTQKLSDEIAEVEKRLPNQEYTLAKCLKQPFSNTNSGSRKIMFGIQLEQCMPINDPEVPIITTGYENQFGQYSSNFVVADKNYVVVAKIPKFANDPNRHYWLILLDPVNDELSCVERIAYKHITEFYGYLFNNDYLDSLSVGDGIEEGQVLKKTTSYDEFNNRAEGLNLATMYIACEDVTEDPIVISESAAKKFMSPLIDKVDIRVNDNDILLNLYGKDKEYKTFPDIGEKVEHSILCAVRRELKDEEALFSQSWDRLKYLMMSDKKYTTDGTVIDIDVFCNNPEKLESSMYNSQIKKYYDLTIQFANNFVNCIKQMIFDKEGNRNTLKLSYDLQKLYAKCNGMINGMQFINDKVFNNIIMYVYVRKDVPLHAGDKITDRYGGKGVISRVVPDNLMPHYLKDGEWHTVDVLYSKCTCINRLNDGQLFETSITYIGWQLLQYIKMNKLDYDKAFELIVKYIELLNPEEANMLREQFDEKNIYSDPQYDASSIKYLRDVYIEGMLNDGCIMLSLKPISSNISIDKLDLIYKTFPFINKHCPVCVPLKDSNGNYRMVYTRRPLVIGYKYIFRLKQLAEEKFSAVSLASTNIRNENSKSRMNKTHNAKFASTPVRIYGEMESSTLTSHLGIDYMYPEFMLTSSSPMARRLHEKLLVGDPFEFNIELTEDCTSQSADIGQAYLKTIGLKYRFIKLKKFTKQVVFQQVVTIEPRPPKQVVFQVPKELLKDKKKLKEELDRLKKQADEEDKIQYKNVVDIVPGIVEENEAEKEYNEKLKRLGLKK